MAVNDVCKLGGKSCARCVRANSGIPMLRSKSPTIAVQSCSLWAYGLWCLNPLAFHFHFFNWRNLINVSLTSLTCWHQRRLADLPKRLARQSSWGSCQRRLKDYSIKGVECFLKVYTLQFAKEVRLCERCSFGEKRNRLCMRWNGDPTASLAHLNDFRYLQVTNSMPRHEQWWFMLHVWKTAEVWRFHLQSQPFKHSWTAHKPRTSATMHSIKGLEIESCPRKC